MATPDRQEVLRIRVLEDSEESGVFLVCVRCDDPILLDFWQRKEPFRNGQVEQWDTLWRPGPSLGLEFILRAQDRAPRLPNAHYWSPFVVALCLDALPFRFHLQPRAQLRGIQEVMRENGELVLLR